MAELPSVENFLYILQKCRKIKDLSHAKLVHAHICNNGLEAHRAVGNYIVPMFVDCGSLTDAQQVFDRLVHRTEHSWTSLILGYIRCGQSQHALNLYQQMQEDSVHPSSFTLVALLKACSTWNDLERGREIHVDITQKGFERELFVGSSLVSMYAKCGSLSEAREVFATLPARDVVLWTALIAGYAEHGPAEALACFEHMQLEGVSPNAVTLICILKACGSIGTIGKGQEIHNEITLREFETYPSVGKSLIDMYTKCGSPSEAQEVFNRLPLRDVGTWNALIVGYSEHGLGQEALKCFEQMQLEGSPDAVTFVCIVKACGSIGSIEKGQEIHSEITLKGLERDPAVGSTLIDMYAKYGSLAEAQEVFDKLQVREVVSWTALIAGYAEHGPAHEALKCFEQMQLEGVSPDAVTFVCALKACSSIGAVDPGQEIHMEVTRRGFERDLYVGNILLDMYAKCGSFLEAQEVFAKLPVRGVVSWNALIAGYTEHGPGQEALKCFEQMQQEGFSPDPVTLICALKACGSVGAIDKCLDIHTEITRKGFETYPLVCSTLVDMYAKCGLISEAQDFFDKLPVRETVSWTALIAGYAEHGPFQEALNCFEQMQSEGIFPNAITFVCVLKACGSIGAIDKGQEIHWEIAQKGFERYPLVGNTLVDMYAKCGSLTEAWEVFAKLPAREVVSWTALIAGYAEHGPCQKALTYFEQMQLEGVSPNAVTFVCMLKACGGIGSIDKGREIHMEITQKGIEREILLGSTLVGMYAKCGSLLEAQEVLTKLPAQDVVSWNALIAGYVEYGSGKEVLKSFEQMQQEGVSPDAVTFVCILKACGSIGAVDKGQEIHAEIIQMGFARSPLVGNTLIDMYAKCSSLSEAWEVFEKLPFRDVVAWNALTAGYVVNHEENMALQCLEDMQEQGVKPNNVTFVCLLTACSQAGLVTKGQEYFKLMREEFGILPTIDHYTCMVDLLARSGQLYEAEKFLETIWCPLSEGTWRALLSSCKTYGEVELGLRCFEQLVKMNPEDASSYRLMADIYVSAGRWDGAYRIEELRKHAGARKKPASSWIEVNSKVQEFVVGNNQSKEISETLDILASRMKEEGHVPNLDLVLRPIFLRRATASHEYA